MAAELSSTALASDGALRGYWKLEDATATNGGLNFTNHNSVTFTAAKFNNGANLGSSNTNKWLDGAGNFGVSGTSDVSLPIWVKILSAPASGTRYCLADLQSTNTTSRYLRINYFNNSGTLRLEIDNSGNVATYNVDLGTSTIHQITAVRTGTTSCKLYLDNVDTGITTAQGSTTAASDGISIGAVFSTGTNPASALLDDFAYLNKAMSAAEVALLATPAPTGGSFLFNFI